MINNLYTAITTTPLPPTTESMHSVITTTENLPTNCSVTYLEENESRNHDTNRLEKSLTRRDFYTLSDVLSSSRSIGVWMALGSMYNKSLDLLKSQLFVISIPGMQDQLKSKTSSRTMNIGRIIKG